MVMVLCLGERHILEVHLTDLQAAKDHAAEFARRLDRLRQLDEGLEDDGNLNHEAYQELEDWILEPFRPNLEAVEDSELVSKRSWTLGQCFSPKNICYRLTVGSEALAYQEQDIEPSRKTMGIPHVAASKAIPIQQQNLLKAFKPDQLIVEWDTSKHDGPPPNTKVRYVDDHNVAAEYFFKSVEEAKERSFSREVTLLLNIQQLQSGNSSSAAVRIPSIIGYVEHNNKEMAGELAAILLQHIDADESMYFLCRPVDEGAEVPNAERKNKWKQQIIQMVKWLHDHDFIWGDVKADNVLIDGQDNAWLIDFGGFTPGWVDEKKENSVAGDLQGVERIIAFLKGEDVQDVGLISSE